MHPTRSTTTRALACLTGALALLVAGCGGSTDPGVAHLGTSAARSTSTAGGAGESAAGGPQAPRGGGAGAEGSEAATAGGGGPEAQKQMVAFAQCMRTHGVPDFPEPQEGKLILKGGSASSLNPSSPQFEAAQKACARFMPHHALSPAQSAEFQAKALKFSACMRSHGVPTFPDPKFEGGGVRLQIGPGQGIDPRSPQFQAAQKACQGDMPGPKGGPLAHASGGEPGGPP
jgi:hypothetical protein